jgi:shikimate kinase
MSTLPRHIVITGLMGAGKTTTGRALARKLGRTWRDSDVDIEKATDRTVRVLRDTEGVEAMHAREAAQLLDALASPEPNVISAAASVVDDARCREAMVGPDVAVVWLHAAPAVLAGRFDSADEHRPSFGAQTEVFLAAQAAQREPLARAIGAHMVDVADLTRTEVVAWVVDALG